MQTNITIENQEDFDFLVKKFGLSNILRSMYESREEEAGLNQFFIPYQSLVIEWLKANVPYTDFILKMLFHIEKDSVMLWSAENIVDIFNWWVGDGSSCNSEHDYKVYKTEIIDRVACYICSAKIPICPTILAFLTPYKDYFFANFHSESYFYLFKDRLQLVLFNDGNYSRQIVLAKSIEMNPRFAPLLIDKLKKGLESLAKQNDNDKKNYWRYWYVANYEALEVVEKTVIEIYNQCKAEFDQTLTEKLIELQIQNLEKPSLGIIFTIKTITVDKKGAIKLTLSMPPNSTRTQLIGIIIVLSADMGMDIYNEAEAEKINKIICGAIPDGIQNLRPNTR
jgi:hypothetical protein